jgi:DNA-binding CsgD family transcriptional regulator
VRPTSEKGLTTEQIAAETGFNPSTVGYYLRRAGIPIRPRGFITQYHIDHKELAKLRRLGVTTKQIAEQYGCSITTVERALRLCGLMDR